ncbi:hypothetical protein L596_022302 [Steinernema carpocapsae]|uniref:Uncharacterized protein n=1 Tax=Steinernema carpocapsae TaxID=34508 RepID=A0A4U5MLD8_STECR|nr:hypothetical protein L596_022302 [Steinernema carpocapsae]
MPPFPCSVEDILSEFQPVERSTLLTSLFSCGTEVHAYALTHPIGELTPVVVTGTDEFDPHFAFSGSKIQSVDCCESVWKLRPRPQCSNRKGLLVLRQAMYGDGEDYAGGFRLRTAVWIQSAFDYGGVDASYAVAFSENQKPAQFDIFEEHSYEQGRPHHQPSEHRSTPESKPDSPEDAASPQFVAFQRVRRELRPLLRPQNAIQRQHIGHQAIWSISRQEMTSEVLYIMSHNVAHIDSFRAKDEELTTNARFCSTAVLLVVL